MKTFFASASHNWFGKYIPCWLRTRLLAGWVIKPSCSASQLVRPASLVGRTKKPECVKLDDDSIEKKVLSTPIITSCLPSTPNRTFHKFTASKSVVWQILYSLKTSIPVFWGCKMVQFSVGQLCMRVTKVGGCCCRCCCCSCCCSCSCLSETTSKNSFNF